MSKYDQDRKEIGLAGGAGSVSTGTSKYDEDRQRMFAPVHSTASIAGTKSESDTAQYLQSVQARQIGEQKQASKAANPDPKLSHYEQWYKDNVTNSPIGKVLGFLDKADRAVSNFKAGALDTATLGVTRGMGRLAIKSLPGGTENLKPVLDERTKSTSYKVGEIAGYIPPGAAIERGVSRALAPALGKAGAVTKGAVTAGIAGLAEGAAQEAGDVAFRGGKFDPLNVALGGAIGGAAGAAIPLIGKAYMKSGLGPRIEQFFNRNKSVDPKLESATRSALEKAEPPAAAALDSPGAPAVLGAPIITQQARSYGRLQSAPVESYINRVMGSIRNEVNQRMTPPLENPNELAKWLRPHIGDDLSLNEIRKLPYDDLVQLAEDVRSNMSMYEVASQVARSRGYDLPALLNNQAPSIKQAAERLRMGAVAGAIEPPQLTIRRPDPRPALEARPAQAAEQTVLRSEPKRPEDLPTFTPKSERPPLPDNFAQMKSEELRPYLNEDEIPFGLDPEDNIVVSEPDEIAPRIRDRINSFADDMIASARAELAQSRNRLSSNPADVYYQYAKVAAGYMLKGTVKLADVTEQLVRDFGDDVRPMAREIFKRAKEQYKAIQRQIETEELGLGDFEGQALKDLSSLNLNTADVYRNFRKVFGKYYEPIKKAVLDPFDEAKGAYAAEQKTLTDQLYRDIVKGLGIKKGSKESALVQRFGEGKINLQELQSLSPDKWDKILEADKWFREQYDGLIDRVNESVARIYPNRPEKLVPRRQDYYRHFQELSAWSGLKNLFDSASNRISPSLSGISPDTRPKTKWASFKQRRGLGEFTNDAVGGFLDYIPAASYAIHIDPHISSFRNLAKRLAEETEQTKNLNNFIRFLNNFANDLAGKTSPVDRWVEEIGGRKALQLLTKANNRVKSNVILGNARSTLSQLANIPNGLAYGGIDAPVGALRTVKSLFEPNGAMSESKFLRERYIDSAFRQFDQRWWEQPKRFAEAMMEISDRVGTSFIWNTAYAKGVRKKALDPVKFADEATRRLVGGRGVGEQPLLIKSKMFNLVAPFQLEVNNLWRVMKDFVDEKRFGDLVVLFTSNWLLNKAFEVGTGSGVVFDPIDAIADAASEEDQSILQRGGRVAGEILSNMPFGQTIASLYPEHGGNMYGAELPSRQELFGDKDPTRFGSGLLAASAITDPVFKFILPYGGNQLKKTITGTDALVRGGAYNENVLTTGAEIEKPKLKFPIEPTLANRLRAGLFGPYATSEGQEYTDNDRRPLSERQTLTYRMSRSPLQYYDRLMEQRRLETERKKRLEAAGR